MGNNATSWILAGCTTASLLVAGLVAGLGDANPAPRGLSRAEVDAAEARGRALVPAAASASVHAAAEAPAAAPAGETGARAPARDAEQGREAAAPRPGLVIAVGTNAAGMMGGAKAERGFAALMPDVELSFAGCRDRDAIELRMTSRVDLALVGGSLSRRERAAGVRQTPLALELFAVAVAPDFPLESLNRNQVRQLLTGEVRDWQPLGCDRGAVVVVVPSQRALAERAARSLILGDRFATTAVRVADTRHVADQILRHPGAIAVVRAGAAPPMGMKLLQIDWTPPTAAAFAYGTYPYGIRLCAVTSGQPDERVQRFLDCATSAAGRELLGGSLLVP